jgi:hypothetical protein
VRAIASVNFIFSRSVKIEKKKPQERDRYKSLKGYPAEGTQEQPQPASNSTRVGKISAHVEEMITKLTK